MIYWGGFKNYLDRRERGAVLLLLMLVCIVYLPFLGNPFFFDDYNAFRGDFIETYKNNWFDLSLRRLPYAILVGLNTVFSDEFPHVYRLVNMLLHVANSVLLFYFLRHLIDAVRMESAHPSIATRGAWFGAAVFALHPVATFAVGYVIQISILMSTMFSLLMLLAYLRGLLTGEKRWFALAVGAYFLACLSKEHSVLMPAVLGAMSVLVSVEKRISRQALWLTWLAFISIAIFAIMQAKGVLGKAYEPMAAQLLSQQNIEGSALMLHLLSALTQAGLFFKYLLLWIFPDPTLMSIDMRESFVVSVWAWQGWLGGIAFLLYGVLGIRLLFRGGLERVAGFAMLYPWLLFLVEMTGIRMQEPFVLYRSYLWMPGMMVFIPLLLTRLPERKSVLAMVGLATVLIALSWGRLNVFSDNYRIWNEAANLLKSERMAGADRIYYNRGQAESAAKKWEDAAADFKRSADISPRLEPIRYQLGVAYGNSGRFEEALEQFNVALAMNPDDDRVYFAKGMTLKFMHRDGEALQQMQRSCELKNQVACILISVPNKHKNGPNKPN
ncbi:lipoprotein NlpI [mine drainage metagenome]|uniref:Lipoprotein NlpI n=1 Tax=mine drainage metagenome TaxID=410659 RepID=A0A1J5TCM2_9ZZZZ